MLQTCIVKLLCLSMAVITMGGCGSSLYRCEGLLNSAPCESYTDEERAMMALRDGDYDLAVELYTKLVEQSPETYDYHPTLASALAGRAGVDLLGITNMSSDNSDSLIDALGALVPLPSDVGEQVYNSHLDDMTVAVATLNDIPQTLIAADPTSAYAVSVVFQKSVYQTLYAVMVLNKFTISKTTGTFSEEELDQMTEDDAVEIIEALENGMIEIDHPQRDMINEKISETLAAINEQPGATTKEKLAEYMKQMNS